MTTYQKSKRITEDEVMFCITVTDIDPDLQEGGKTLRVEYNNIMYRLDITDLIGWMFEQGKIDNWGNDLVQIEADGNYPAEQYTFSGYVRENMNDPQFESSLIEYMLSPSPKMEIENPFWYVIEGREEVIADGEPISVMVSYTPGQLEALAEEAGLNEPFSHPNNSRS